MQGAKVVVVGASSGIGAELTKQLTAQGAKVVALARRSDLITASCPAAIAVTHDVTDYASVPGAFSDAVAKLGGLDTIYYCAGTMPLVAPAEYDFEKDRQMVEVNLLGGIAWLDQAADYFRNAGAGTIVGIGSVAGDRGRAGQPVYNASKAGFHTYLEALRNRLSKQGICVVTIKPGPVATEMSKHVDPKRVMPVEVAAAKIIAFSNKPGEHYLSPIHRIIFAIIRNIPGAIFRKLGMQ